ncbi:hypothetical protein PDJAM_G00191160 [Pangasius djambal]|uniref:Uncharacterized protein n=1 Tax=Pangasius djambal TaxID=1691987 RepID=A0ACC5Y6J5_9TELE|nr:hypothetical protein [Pangasius djambal]
MASERTSEDSVVECGSLPLDIDDVHILLQVEQEQIQKRTFTNWVNAQLSKRRPPLAVVDLFSDFRDGSRLLDLLEVMCSQRMSREKGRGVFQHRTNIEKALAFLRGKSIKLVNINVSDIMDGKPSIILGLIWTIIMHFHIEELASTLSFSSRQSSLESLASLDTYSTSSSARSSPVPPRGSPLHTRFRISAKKALLLWVREQCHKAGCTLTVKDFKASWRSGVVFLAILCALRPDVVSLSKAKTRSNRQNLEEAFRIAERELHIPRLLDPADVDVRDPDEKSIMTYVAQFLQYSKDAPASEEDMQVQYLTPTTRVSPVNLPCNFTPAVAASPLRQISATQKAQEVTCWLEQAYQELLEGWESTEGESYAERYHVFQTFVVSFNEQRRPVMPMLTAMKRTVKLSEEQRALRHAWDSLAEKLREYKTELDLSLPAPLDTVGRWLLRAEEALADGDDDRQDHARAAQEAREKHELFKSCLEEMPRHMKTFQIFQNTDEYGEMVVPTDKLEEIKRRFTSVRVSTKYHGIRLEYQEHRHTVLDLLSQLTLKLCTWKRGYISQEAVRVLMKDWNETVNKQGLPSMLEGTLCKLRHIVNKYTSKSALAGDSNRVRNQMKDLEAETASILEEVKMVKGTITRTLTAWDSYCDTYSSLHAWLEQGTQTSRRGQRAEVTIEMMSEWSSRRERLNEFGNYLMDVTDPQTSRSVSDDLCRINLMWADFVRKTQFELVEEQNVTPPSPQTLQGLIREATQLLKEPVEVLSGSIQTYRKRLQFMMKKIQDIDLDSLSPSLECSAETLNKLKQAIPEVLQTLCEAMQVCEELQQSVSGLDGRLAELIHWEAEVREFYELLKEKSHRHQRGQDSRTRSLISRGLQLEGQVVMEEQDLQEMVMSRQKNSPLQYLIASTMQDRVRATVAQSQEAVGMLSSLGARRDRSPTGRQPPQKVFVQEQEVSKPQTQPQPVPMIVVQEYQEEQSQIQALAKPQLRKESMEGLAHLSKPEASAQPQIFPEVMPQRDLVGVVALGEPKRQKRGDTKETMESQPHHLDTKQSSEQIQQVPTRQQPLTVQQEPTQPQVQLDTQQQTLGEQQVQIQKQSTSQHQTLFQQSVKVRKSQKRAENRPWLQQKAQAEVLASDQVGELSSEVPPQPKIIAASVSQPPVSTSDPVQAQAKVTWIQQQQPIMVTTSVASQAQISTTDTNQGQAKRATQTQAKVTQAQQQQPVTVIAKVASQPMVSAKDPIQSEPKNVIHTQFQVTQVQQQQSVMQAKVSQTQQVTQTKVGQFQQQQPVTQAKLGQVHQQPPVSQMLAKEQVPAMALVTSQKQPQALTVQQHPQPFTATTFTQPPAKQSEMQPPFMTQMQRPVVTQPPIMSPTMRHTPTPIQPQIITQRQPHPVAAQSPPQHAASPNQFQGVTITPAQPKSTAPVQPRIITMPQSQPQFYKPPQSPPQVMGMGQTHDNIQLRPQLHIQQPQWRPIMSDTMIQSYHETPHQGFMPSHTPPQAQVQSHPQSQGVTETQAQPQQWAPLRGGLATQTYPNVQGSGHVQPYAQSQGYPSPQPQSQQWGQFRFEPTVQPYLQISPQSPVQSFVPSQHWQPIRQSNMVSHSYPRVQVSEYSQVHHQVTPRPQSPPQKWPMQPEPQSQVQFLKMVPQPMAHAPFIQPPSQAPVRPQGPAPQQPQTQQQQWPQNRPEVPFQVQIQSQTLQSQPQGQVLQKPQWPVQEEPQQHLVAQVKPPAQAQAPPQAYSEAYAKAQALARNKFEDAKHCLQEHILEAINIFKGKKITQEQVLFKEYSLDFDLLKEFLSALQGMEAFCTPSQVQDMELFTQSVRTQWEACSSAESSVVPAEQQLEALKQLCETLSPEDINRLAQAQLRECETALTAIQRQSSGDHDVMPTDSGVLIEQTKETSPQKTDLPEKPVEITTETSAVAPQRPKTVEKKEILKQISTEEDRYRSYRFALQAQLNRNEQNMLGDRSSGSATATDLQKRLRELKALQDETESLWSEYEVQCSQCSQINERTVEQDRAELTVKWREQRAQLQRRVGSLGSALELMDSIEHHIAEISERLDKFIKEPKDVRGYTLINANILKDVKDLDESIQTQMDRLSRFDSEPSHLDLRDRSPLTQLVLKHRASLDRLRQQVRKSEAAARALDRFLVSLRTLDQDVSFVQSDSCADVTALQDSRSKLALIRKGAASLSDKAPQLDQLLGGAQMEVTQEGSSVTCLDMVAVLVRKVEDADDKLIIWQEERQKEQQSKGLGMRKKTLLAELRKVQGVAEKQGLKEPTMPAVQHRRVLIRALSDLETQMNSLRPEYESIRETARKLSTDTEQHDEMESVWEETERAVAERQEQCSTLMDLLKKFQSCRAFLGNILQRAEQTISEQASYMSKDNLQRLIARVCGIKEDLNGLGPKIEEFRVVCRQLQSQLKKLPYCSETPFEAEADTLVDSWLDVSEKTDSYVDSLRMGLEVWEKQLMLGGELEVWVAAKLCLFAKSHPFSNEKEVFEMKDEILKQEQSIDQFHRKSLEIQELLQSKEAPLELQVMETALKKKIEQVKELFDSRTEVFRELLSVRAHLLQRIDTCQTAIQRIHSSVRMLCADNKDLLQQHLQDHSDQLLDQEEEADSLIKEVELMSSMTAPQALEELSNKSKRLKDNVAVTRHLIGQKEEQGEKSVLVQSIKDECQMFEDWLQDAQLAVNECFENPEMRESVEVSMQKLQDFLASEEGEQRLAQVKKALEKKGQETQVPAETQAELCAWQQEQEGELTTLRAHCQGRHNQLEDILIKLSSLQAEHDHFQDWLRQRDKLPEQREKLRQVHEDFLKESGRVEAFSDLLASVRLKGLRGDPLLIDSESLVDQYHSLGIRLENQSQIYKSLEKEVEIFHIKEENTRTWVRNLKRSLESLDKDKEGPTEEKLLKIQAVLDLRVEGDSKMAGLKMDGKSLCDREELEESTRQELIQTLRNIVDEWRRVLDSAQQIKAQAELQQTLLKELEALQDEEKNTRSWVDEQMRKLDFLDKDTPIQERHSKLQEVLSLKHEGDSKLITLRKKGESICAHTEWKRDSTEQSQRELEEEWARVLQTAREMNNQIEHEDSLSKELKSFQDQLESMQSWIRKLKVTLQSMDKASPAEEIIIQAQTVLVHGPEGDSKLAALKHTGECVYTREGFKEDTRQSIQQTQRALEQEWREVLDFAQILRSEAEIQVALDKELRDFNSQEEIFRTWVMDHQKWFESQDRDAPLQEILVISQTILNLQPEADLKMVALKSKGENLCAKLDESRKESIQQTLRDVEEKLRVLMEIAQEHRNQAELQGSLSKELQTFQSEEKKIQSWVEELKQDLVSLGKSTHGTQEQIEERLNKAQAVLSLRPEGNCKMSSLKRKAESLCGREDLDEQTRWTLVQNLKSLEEEWKGVLQNAQELHSLLRSVVERLVSCQCQRQQTQSRVEQLKQQAAALPRHFPWPGLGDRRHAVEQAMALLGKARSLSPTLSALRALGREMSQLTRDPSWTDPSWAAMEECVPGLIKDLMELCESLEEGICTERNCVQLVEQHSAAQDWLREQVKGFGALPSDRHGLQGSINTLKALLQTVEREEREMRELDSAKDALISLCTPGGRDALALETGHLHDLCAASEREIKERLVVCETRLADIKLKIAERAERLRAQAECILNDLRAQECLGFVEGNRNISQLQENWNILKTCEKELKAIEGKVRDLGQAIRMVPPDEDLPSNVISLVDTVTQQYCRLQSKLSERQNDCADSAVHCMRDTLQALRSWTQSTHTQTLSDSTHTIQGMIEEGAVLHKNLQEAVSHKQLLRDCLGQELTDRLERDGSNALKDADTLINQLQERLQDLEEDRMKNKALTLSLETQPSHLVSEVSCGWPSTHTLDTTTKVDLDWSKPQDISSAPVASAKSSVLESFEMVHRDVAMSIIEEPPAKTEQPLETVVQDDVLADYQSDDTLTLAPEQKSGVSEVSMTVDEELLPESHAAEPLPVSALDESGAEFKNDDLPTTTSTITSKLEEPTDVAGSESLRTGIQSLQADLHVLESVTERIKPSEELEERALKTPVSTIVDREIPTELSEEISGEIDFPTADWSLTALHFDQSKLKTDGLSTTALAVQSDVVPEVDESAIGPAKAEEKTEMKGMEKVQLALCDKLHDAETVEGKPKESTGSDKSTIYAHSLDQESDAFEEAHRKRSFTSDTCELMSEDGKMPKKKTAALILDTDIVNIHATEVPCSTDHNAGRIDSASDTGFDATLSQQIERLDTSDETRKEFDSHTSLDQQELESAGNVVDSTKSSQPPEENVDRTLQTLLLSGQTTETQIITGSSEPTTTHAEREGSWTTNNGPQEVQRVMEPLEHWTVNNGPREIQRRYIILERREGLEICQEPAAETNVPVLDATASKPGRVVTDVSELEVTENVEQEVGKESVETDDSERVALNAKKQSETLEIIGTLPAPPGRRKLERLSFSTEDKLAEEVDKVIVEVESTKRTTVKGETKPTPPSRRSKESERLSVSSEALSEEANIPVPTSQQYKQDETQLPPAEVLPTPPNRRHKDKLGDEMLSLDLDSTTPPERRQKEKAEHHQLEQEKKSSTTAVEEPLVNPTPPVRRKESWVASDSTSVVSQTQKMEETLVKPTPPTRRRDSRNVTEPVCDSSDLDKTRTKEIAAEESLEKPTPPVRRKASPEESDFINPLVSKPQGTEDLLVKPTPPTRRRDSGSVRDIVSKEMASQISKSTELEKTVMQGSAVEEILVKPTPPVRRKISQVSQTQEMEEILVKPTPPARRRGSRNFSDRAYEEMASKISRSTDLEKTFTQERALEEPLIKPTPPVRRKVSSHIEIDTVSVLSKIQEVGENVVKPTPPIRRRDSGNMSGIVASSTYLEMEKALAEPLLKPTPPVRRKASQIESNVISFGSKAQEIEATLLKPTPPIRRRNSGNMTDMAASRISSSCDLENSTLVTPERALVVFKPQEIDEKLVRPTPPAERRESKNVNDTVATKISVSSDLENLVTEDRAAEEALVKSAPLEEALVKPTCRRDSRNVDEIVSKQIESEFSSSTDLGKTKERAQERADMEVLVKLIPLVGQEASQAESDISIIDKTQEIEETLVKPTTLARRRDSRNVDETVPKQMESEISSSADLDKTVTQECAEVENLVKPTPPVGQEASQAESNISSVVFKPQEPDETLVKPTPPTRRGSKIKSNTVAEVSQSEVQDGLIEPTLREKDSDVEHESVSTEPEEALPKPTTPIDQKEDTTTPDLDTIPIKVEEPPIQSISPTASIEKSVEIQPMIKQEDEQPEKELCSALGMESTEGLTEIKSISLVEAQLQDADKAEIPNQVASVARTVDVSEALEEEEQEEESLGATMNNIFTEIEKMSKTRPNSLLIESRHYEDPLDILNTSDADLEAQLNRLVFCILSCRNCPAVLNPTDMAKQVEEAEFCRQSAQKQVSSISKQDHINGDVRALAIGSAHDPEAMQRLSCQWTEALWDASGTVHTKEAQLQLVIDYDRQMQKAKATLEKLAGELESLKMCPVESSFVEEQRLRSFLRTMEQERTVLGELIQTYSQLSLHLSHPERAAAQSQQSILQCEWKELEKSAEKTLHNVSAYTKESFDLLEDINTLKDHMENFHKILGSPWISSAAWDSKRAQAMIELSAEFTAAKQRYFDLHQSFETFSQGCNFKMEAYNIQQGLWCVKDHMDVIAEELAFSTPTSNNPIMVKIVKVITEALVWAKKTEYDIENRQRKVSLLPEEVHRQIKDLKKLHSEMTSKQTQLTTLTEEVTQLIPDLDEPDVPVVTSFLELLASLSKSTAEKLASAMEEIQLSLQTREKISEQVADVDSWILCHLHKESLSREDFQSLCAADLDRMLRHSQDTLREAEKHSGIAEALLMKSKDITSELSISENARLYEKLTKLQEDIKGIINYEKSSILEITDILQNQESSEQKMASLEQKLRQIMIDMKGHTFPITKESLSAIEPFKRMLVEHKFQIEQINTSAEGRRRELLCVISELHHKMKDFHFKSQIHERFLSLKQRVEDLRENVELYVPKTKDESIAKEERYKICQSLLTQIPLIKLMYKEASDELTNISPDLYPSQLTTEQERLQQNLDSLNTWEMAIRNNLHIVEWDILKEISYLSAQRVVRDFLKEVNEVLEKTYEVEYNQGAVEDELRKFLKLKKNIEARMRVLEVLEIKNGHQQGSQNAKDIADLAKSALDNCDQRLVDLSKAKESLKNYSRGVRSAIQFLQRTESVLLPSLCSPRSCSERLKDVQQALLTLDKEFQSPLTEIQTLAPFSPLFSAQKVEQLQAEILGCLLVRMSTLKAQAQLRLEALERCVNSQRSTRVCYEELCRHVRDSETTLAECASKKITSQMDCHDQQETLKTLVKEIDTLPGKLDELREWCPVQGCRGNRDDAVNSLWGQVARLRQCARHLLEHSDRRGEEWIRVGKSMEKASSVLEQMEAELPESSREKATAEELQELLQFWSPYQDRLDCEHRALSALELRVARLLRVPSHLEQAPPIQLCQELQAMQERYHSLKSRSARGRKAVHAEMEERTKVCEELQGIRDWLVAAGTVLSELERAPNTERLQELHSELCTQKAVLQRIMEGLRMKYSDMYTLVPMEIDSPLQEVSHSLQEVVKQVEVAVQKSGPLHRLDAKLSEINTGLDAVQSRLKNKRPNVPEAESAQKHVWDELDGLHSHLAEVEVELQDLNSPLQEVSHSLQEVVKQVEVAVQKSGPLHRLDAKLSEINTGLDAVQSRLKNKRPNVPEAESAQKHVWDELDGLHSHLAEVEVELQDLSEEKPEEMQALMEKLSQTQQLHTCLSKQAEDRTAFLNKARLI